MDKYTEAIIKIQRDFNQERARAESENDERRMKTVELLEEFFTQQLRQYTRFQELLLNYADKKR